MGELHRDRLPAWPDYAQREGLVLAGRGKWRTTRCDLHGGSDSLRVNVESGGWCCMACGAHGGDVLAFAMQRYGLTFVEAALGLGAYVENGHPHRGPDRPRAFSSRDALDVLLNDVLVCTIVIADARRGVTPNEADWRAFLDAAGRIQFIAQEILP